MPVTAFLNNVPHQSTTANWEAVIQSDGTLVVIPTGTPVPYGIRSVNLGEIGTGAGGSTLAQKLQSIGATTEQVNSVIHALDSGSIMRGYPIAVPKATSQPAGAPAGATPQSPTLTNDPSGSATGSEAVAANIIPSPNLSGLSGIFNIGNFVRVVEVFIGAIILFLGLHAMTGRGSGDPVQLVRKVAKR